MKSGSPRRRSQHRTEGPSARRVSSAGSGAKANRRWWSAARASGSAASRSLISPAAARTAARWARVARRRRSSQVPTVSTGPSAANTAMIGDHTRASTAPAATGRTMPAHDSGSGSGRGGAWAGAASGAGSVGGTRRGGRLNGTLPAAAPRPARTAAGTSSGSVRQARLVAPTWTAVPGGTGVGSARARRTPSAPRTVVGLRAPRSARTGAGPDFTRRWRRDRVGSSMTTSQPRSRPTTQVPAEGRASRSPTRSPPITAKTGPGSAPPGSDEPGDRSRAGPPTDLPAAPSRSDRASDALEG